MSISFPEGRCDATVQTSKVHQYPVIRKVHLPVEDEDRLRKFLDENLHLLDPSRFKDIHHLKRKLDARRSKRNKGSKLHSLDKNEVERLAVYSAVQSEKSASAAGTSPSKPLESATAAPTSE